MAASDFLTVPMTSGSATPFQLVADALAGRKRVEIFIDGDSRTNVQALSGYHVKAGYNAAIMQLSANGLVDTGWVVVDSACMYATQMPVRCVSQGATVASVPVAKLPARWPEMTMAIAHATTPSAINGHFFSLHSDGEMVEPTLGCGAGAQTPWWDRAEGQTYVYVACLCSQAGTHGDEITVRVTPTDNVSASVGASPTQTFTTGQSGVPALLLRSDPLSAGRVKIARIGPITFNDGSLRRVAQINVTSGVANTLANVLAVKFSRETASGPIPGLAVSVLGQKSGHRIGGATQSHLVTNNDASQAYQALTTAVAGCTPVYGLTANINDIYLDGATAAVTAGYARDRIAQVRGWIGGVPAYVMSHPDRCLAAAEDAQSDLLPAAFHSTFGSKGSGVGVLNYRRNRHMAGYNRGSEFVTGLTISRTNNSFDAFSGSVTVGVVRGLGGNLGAVRAKGTTTVHPTNPAVGPATEWATCLQHVNFGDRVNTLDHSHDAPQEAYPAAMAVLSMMTQAAAQASFSGNRIGRF